MPHSRPVKSVLVAAPLLGLAIVTMAAQSTSAPNPYREDASWAKLPSGAKWGGVISIDPAANGDMWVFHRSDPPVLRFDPSGKVVKSFGEGMIVQAHGMTIDRDGNVWVTDAQLKDGKGNQVLKFSPDGKLLMSLGKAGVAGSGNDVFSGPCDVAIAQNGDIFVADGHIADVPVNRVMRFSKDGKFIKAWGKRGTGPGEFDTPHSIAIDSRGRIFVADRSNSRIQIFDQDGKFIDQWKQFGRPSGIYIDRNDNMVVADSQSNSKQNPGFKRGIYVGSARDGKVTALIPFIEPDAEKNNNAGVEGVAIDAKGNVYGAEVSTEMLKKYVKASATTTR
jgi:DNA-binding beta-propeller fold protein YncE